MQEHKINILSTAMLNESLVEDLSAADVGIHVIPFIEVTPLADARVREMIKPYINQFAFIVVTSSNAVETIAANLENATPSWRFFCVGQKTRQLVHKYFGASAILETANNASELAETIIKCGVFGDLILFCGDQRRDELPDQLNAGGVKATELVVYETKLTPHKIEQRYDAVLFFSPSAVKSFFSINKVPPDTVFFSIGPTTEEELENYTDNKIIVADKPDKEEVLKKAIEYFNK